MDIITKFRTSKNKLTLMGAFSLIGSNAYSNYTISEMLLFITLFLFADMMDEDAKSKTIDIKKIAVLGIFFFLASKEPMGNFIITAIVTFFIFRIIYLLGILKYSRKNNIETLRENDTLTNSVKLLPSFALAFFILGLYLEITHTKEPIFLLGFQEFLKETASFLSQSSLFWICFLILWLLLEFMVKRYAKQEDVEIVEGLGRSDIIVFPFFAAFLGITPFLFILFLGCIIQLLQYLMKNIQIVGRFK